MYIASIMQLPTCVMKIVHVQVKSPKCGNQVFPSIKEEFPPSRSEFFPFREVAFMKRDSIAEDHFSFRLSLSIIAFWLPPYWISCLFPG